MLESWFSSKSHRTEQLERIAKELELSFAAKDEFGLINLLKDFKLFRRGGRKRITNILGEKEESLEGDFRVFDYRYTISTGKSSRTFRQTVFFVQSKKLGLPEFYMQPEHFFYKIGNYLGIEDIDFEEFPQFSDQYWLKGKDEAAVRRSMNAEILHFFTIEKYWSLEGLNYFLIFYSKNKVLHGDQVKMLYHKGKQIVEMFSEK
ncbi:MAG: hypothetical protein AB8G86_12115 [Saprospiraceae bacterium]